MIQKIRYYNSKKISVLVVFIVIVSMARVGAQQPSMRTINWSEFISRHNLVWDELPLQWNEGAFTGNGMLGMMVYVSEKDSAIVFNLGRTDVTDHRKAPNRKTSIGEKGATVTFDFCRLPVGKMLLKPGGRILSGKITQDIWNAEIKGMIETTNGRLYFKAFVPRSLDVQVIEVREEKKALGSKTYKWKFIPGNAHSPRALVEALRGKTTTDYQPNPKPELTKDKNYNICKQSLLAGGDYATVWTTTPNGTLFMATANEVPKADASVSVAMAVIKSAQQQGAGKLTIAHRKWWHSFYTRSFLSIPDARLESFYWIQLYKMASASRPGGPAVDLFGPYYKTSAWPGMWWNLNIQLTYFPVYESNHLELGENMIDIVDENFDGLLERFASRNELGDMVWTLHNYWRQFAYAANQKSLANKWLPKAIKVLEAYEKKMIKNTYGKIELAPMKSPEYHDNATFPNTSYNLACLNWLLNTMVQVSTVNNINQSKIKNWKTILDNLIPYPVNENGLMIGSNQGVDESHRHYSHLLALYPLFQLNPDEPADSALVDRSVVRWHTVGNGKALAGYSYTGAASLFAALGRGNDAVKNLGQLLDGNTGISQFHTNTFYTESGGRNEVIETPLSGAASVMELLMQSRNHKISVFPAMPTNWKNAVFADLLAEDGYTVSGSYQNGQPEWITVTSKTGAPFTLKCKNIKSLKSISATGVYRIQYGQRPDEMQVTLQAGTTLTLKSSKQTQVFLGPVVYNSGKINSFGIKKGQRLSSLQDYNVQDFWE